MTSVEVLAIGIMAIATYLTRVAGPLLLSLLPDRPRISAYLDILATSMLAAIVLPAAFGGDVARALGVGAAVAIMLRWQRPGGAMLGALLVTAAVRQIV